MLDARHLGDGLEVTLQVKDGDEAVVLRFESTNVFGGRKASILAPGVQVKGEPPASPESKKSGVALDGLGPTQAVLVTTTTNVLVNSSPQLSISFNPTKTNAPAKSQ